jgi:hypothetical protein
MLRMVGSIIRKGLCFPLRRQFELLAKAEVKLSVRRVGDRVRFERDVYNMVLARVINVQVRVLCLG